MHYWKPRTSNTQLHIEYHSESGLNGNDLKLAHHQNCSNDAEDSTFVRLIADIWNPVRDCCADYIRRDSVQLLSYDRFVGVYGRNNLRQEEGEAVHSNIVKYENDAYGKNRGIKDAS